MIRDITIGQYYPADSVLHKMDPRAKLVGGMLPLAAKKLGADPAIMATPFITTIVDACSLILYFQIAQLVFKNMM